MPGPDAHGQRTAENDVVVAGAPPGPHSLLGSRYELIRLIARGGMAEVWEGRDATLRRPVAVKVLLTHLAADTSFVERFRREAVTAARVAHPCVVATYDAGVDDGTAYIVMELVEGQTLRQLLADGSPLEPALAVAVAVQIADALAQAHRVGLVHRDVKPANILLCDDGNGSLRVKVTDFGIAKVGRDVGADLTATGMVLGTPKYLSPEQVEGKVDPDARSDLYALGVVTFEMLTGRVPFNGPTEMATALSHLRDTPPRVRTLRPGIAPALDALVVQLLAKDPADRPPTAVAARQALAVIAKQGATERAGADRPRAGASPYRSRGAADDRPASLNGAVGNAAWPAPDRRERTPPGGRPRPGPTGGARRPGVPFPGADPSGPRTGRQAYRSGPATAVQRAPRREDTARHAPAAPGPAPASRPAKRRRSSRAPGVIVAVVVLAAVAVGAVLVTGGGPSGRRAGGARRPGGSRAAPVRITGASVWLAVTGHTLDHPGEARLVYDHNPATAWSTVGYNTPSFGNLYDGEGLAIRLGGTHRVTSLTVDSPTHGWAASTYVSSHLPPVGTPLSSWGTPTAHRTAIAGDATFSLRGRRGSWVLLWMTYLGPSLQISVSEVTVH